MGYVCCDRGVLYNRDICTVVNLFRLMGTCGVFLTELICVWILLHFRNKNGYDNYNYQF